MIRVRDIEENDLEKIMNWRMRPDITKWMNTDPMLSLDKQLEWFRKIQEDSSLKHWMIVIDDVDSGVINIADVNETSASWAYYIAERSKRSMANAISIEMSLYRYCFDKLNLRVVNNEVLSVNKGVIQLHKMCGNVVLEEKKGAVEKNGELYDVTVMSIDADKWHEISNEIDYEYVEF